MGEFLGFSCSFFSFPLSIEVLIPKGIIRKCIFPGLRILGARIYEGLLSARTTNVSWVEDIGDLFSFFFNLRNSKVDRISNSSSLLLLQSLQYYCESERASTFTPFAFSLCHLSYDITFELYELGFFRSTPPHYHSTLWQRFSHYRLYKQRFGIRFIVTYAVSILRNGFYSTMLWWSQDHCRAYPFGWLPPCVSTLAIMICWSFLPSTS